MNNILVTHIYTVQEFEDSMMQVESTYMHCVGASERG